MRRKYPQPEESIFYLFIYFLIILWWLEMIPPQLFSVRSASCLNIGPDVHMTRH